MSRGHRSIGEVLSLLSHEHPDLTISKIRFLESQGLIDPQRTPSGYRKFFDADIERLHWVLTEQRDNFLPLKEIKRRLADGFVPATRSSVAGSPTATATPTPSLFSAQHRGASEEASAVTETLEGSLSLTTEELASAVGVETELVDDLQRMGLIEPVTRSPDGSGEPVFDHEALLTTRTAAAFGAHGLPVRNLRMFKVAADREAGVYEQIVATLMARGDTARLRSELAELTDLAESLRRSLLRRLLHPHLD